MAKKKAANLTAGALRQMIERVERLNEEIKALQADRTSVFAEAKSLGFDTKIMRAMVRERQMDEGDRQEWLALLDLYRGALGMLDGTPLGEAARNRFESAERPETEQANREDDLPEPSGKDNRKPPQTPNGAMGQVELDDAREKGRTASKSGVRVIDNPYLFGDPRRACWDEGWCQASGSDGMQIPEAWRRKRKPKSDGDHSGKGE
jgi:uncharacterized protein (UPF0335 family)